MGEELTLGAAVAARRKQLRLTQTTLAQISGVSRGTIRNLESGLFDPNPQTWRAVQGVLGWATGSRELIERGEDPIEVLSSDALALIIGEFAELLDSDFQVGELEPLFLNFRNIMSAPNKLGEFPKSTLNTLVDFVYQFPWEGALEMFGMDLTVGGSGRDSTDEGIEAAQETLIQRLHASVRVQERAKSPIVEPTLPRVEGISRTAIPNLTKARHLVDQTAFDQLSDDVKKLISEGQVIDYGVHEPEGIDNLAVVALLVKKSSAPLSRLDRQYLSSTWSDLPDALSADKAEEAKPTPAAPFGTPAPGGDPWGTPVQAKSTPDEEPPF